MANFRKHKITLITVGLILFLPAASQNKDTLWKKKLDKNEIEIYTRHIENYILKESKASRTFNLSITEALNILTDFESYPKWVNKYIYAQVLEKLDETEYYYYVQIDIPDPLNDRDLVNHVKVVYKSKNEIRILINAHPNRIDKHSKYVRIPYYKGSWTLEAISETQTKLTFQIHADPGGIIPGWVANLVMTEGPYNTLFNLGLYVNRIRQDELNTTKL